MRFFNTAGPVHCEDHYCLPPLERFNLSEILSLVEQKKYFVLHAPRQTGKTSSLLALMDHLNGSGNFHCVYFNVEAAQGARENVYRGMKSILNEMALRARVHLDDHWPTQHWPGILETSGEDNALNEILTQWAMQTQKSLVLLVDEIDALIGDTLISVLRQIRSGYDRRGTQFPRSIILCGVRDVRDYRIHSEREQEIITGGSAFNIKAKSLRLGNFTRDEIERVYQIHTEETGQEFESGTMDLTWEYTKGQPWLVNALGYEVCFEMEAGRDRTRPITSEMLEQAKENLILRRETHLDQLADKLREPRVRSVIEPLLTGTPEPGQMREDDIQYVTDLGLIQRKPQLTIANKIYQEIVPRLLAETTQDALPFQTQWYVAPDGRLDMEKLLTAFQEFFREHSEHWVGRFDYKEAGPQLLLQAFLQRIVNSGGRIDREYGLGRRRTDLMVAWPVDGGLQKVVLELKILYKSRERTLAEGLEQTADYMDKCGADEGHLIIFDRRPERTWDEKIFRETRAAAGKTVTAWGM
ncbi:MAG: ATP-binding protein [Desulfococcaceae bacterium]